ncbi:hypothetical protein [Sinorhizobium mexicanum]|uniref:hypothetical protein n=1 Tax=Sinorhizobium mexicanum TaxID=375549 RepID=UPI0022B80736|nr:hypothetical protein [Sinorhizobium mexicanum]
MALVPGLAKTVGEAGLAQLTMSACLPAIGVAAFSKSSTTTPYYPRAFGMDCIRFNDSVLDILKNRPGGEHRRHFKPICHRRIEGLYAAQKE